MTMIWSLVNQTATESKLNLCVEEAFELLQHVNEKKKELDTKSRSINSGKTFETLKSQQLVKSCVTGSDAELDSPLTDDI